MNQNLEKKWFIVQIKPNSYNSAIQNLERQGFDTFLPKMQITQRQKQKFIIKDVYVFPGYMFVCFDPSIISCTRINSTYGVSKILAFNKKPAEISYNLILSLKNNYEKTDSLMSKESLKKGDTIKFNSGPFLDLIARIENVDSANRIWVFLDIMGGYKKLKIEQKEKLNFYKV